MQSRPGQAPEPPRQAYSVGPAPAPGARRLHLNEFRFGHAGGVLAALAEAAAAPADEQLSHYRAGACPRLAADIARYVGAPSAASVLLTPGSDDALRAAIDTSPQRGHEAVIAGAPGYTHFEHYARLKPLRLVTYSIGLGTPPADHAAALRDHAAELTAGCLVYLCSPNNPTGDMWEPNTVAGFAAAYPRSLFLVDEAYIEFVGAGADVDVSVAEGDSELYTAAARHLPAGMEPLDAALVGTALRIGADGATASSGEPGPAAVEAAWMRLNSRTCAAVALAFPNVVVTRTFSKAFGLAAQRLGYAVGQPATLDSLRVAVSPKAFGPAAFDVARAALAAAPHYWLAAAAARRAAQLTIGELRARGWWVAETPANFFLLYAGTGAAALTAALARHNVLVRNRDNLPGLAGFVRVSAGTLADGRALVTAMTAIGAEPPGGAPPQTMYTPKGHVAAVKSVLRRALSVLADANIYVWAQGGTLLGALRHGGMIPSDDDADLAYFAVPAGIRDPVEVAARRFAEAGLSVQRNRTGAYWQIGTNAPGEALSAAHVDLFSYSLRSTPAGPRYTLDDPRFAEEDPDSAEGHCNTQYSEEELFPLRPVRFHDMTLRVPARAEHVLRRALGEDCMTIMRMRVRGADGSITLREVPLRDASPA